MLKGHLIQSKLVNIFIFEYSERLKSRVGREFLLYAISFRSLLRRPQGNFRPTLFSQTPKGFYFLVVLFSFF